MLIALLLNRRGRVGCSWFTKSIEARSARDETATAESTLQAGCSSDVMGLRALLVICEEGFYPPFWELEQFCKNFDENNINAIDFPIFYDIL